MSNRWRRCFLILVVAAISSSGCVSFTGTSSERWSPNLSWLTGRVTRTLRAPIEASVQAAELALRDLGLPVDDRRIGRGHGIIDSRLGNGEPVLIDFDEEAQPIPTDPTHTRVAIRISTFGDEKLSRRILDQIEQRLTDANLPSLGVPNPTGALPPPPARTLDTDEPPMAR